MLASQCSWANRMGSECSATHFNTAFTVRVHIAWERFCSRSDLTFRAPRADTIHNTLSSTMATYMGPADPVFMNHQYVDRVHADFQRVAD